MKLFPWKKHLCGHKKYTVTGWLSCVRQALQIELSGNWKSYYSREKLSKAHLLKYVRVYWGEDMCAHVEVQGHPQVPSAFFFFHLLCDIGSHQVGSTSCPENLEILFLLSHVGITDMHYYTRLFNIGSREQITIFQNFPDWAISSVLLCVVSFSFFLSFLFFFLEIGPHFVGQADFEFVNLLPQPTEC